MTDYDGFATVQNPQDYMNAPAMIIPPDGDGDQGHRSAPPILRAAINAAREFELLSADEIQAHYAEQNVLQQRINDVISRLDVEVKMREAARSLSRLHRKPSDASLSPSVATSSGKSARKRISKIFSASSGSGAGDAKDKRLSAGPQNQRHSMQADEEAEISSEKIRHLEQLRFDLSQRKALVDRRIVQHHAAVMSRALGGVPLPNHRRLQSGVSVASNWSGTSTPGQRQSWVVADSHAKHMRSISGVSAHSAGADSSLATVREHGPTSAGSPAAHNSRLEEEVNVLAGRVAQAIPGMSPAPQGAMTFISNAFERLLRELADTRNSAEAYHIQAQHSEERIEFLNRELEQAQAGVPSRSVSGTSVSEPVGRSPGHDAEIAQLRHELDAERRTLQQLRNQAGQQRAELDRTVRSLEEVTRLSVQYEGERAELEQLLAALEAKTGALEEDKAVLLQQRLGATQNSSLLCKEFQRIVGDLVEQHRKELRQLHPRLQSMASASKTSAQQQQQQQQQQEPQLSLRQSDGNSAHSNGQTSSQPSNSTSTSPLRLSPHPPAAKSASSQASQGAQGGTTKFPSQNSGAHDFNKNIKERMVNSEFSQSPEPLSVHSAVRKPVPQSGLNVPDRAAGGQMAPELRSETAQRTPGSGANDSQMNGLDGDLHGAQAASDHRPLPAPLDSDMSLTDEAEDGEDDLSAPRLERVGSKYSANFSEYSRSSSVYPEANSAAQSQASVLVPPYGAANRSQASIARAQDYSFNSNDELL